MGLSAVRMLLDTAQGGGQNPDALHAAGYQHQAMNQIQAALQAEQFLSAA